MGGNALAYYGARRFNKEEYGTISTEVLTKLRKVVPKEILLPIPYYFSKESFGDLDLLCLPLSPEDYSNIIKALGSDIYVRNSEVISILYKELQVDIIPMPNQYLTSSYNYYSFNDLGNLLGRIFHKMGLKYGHKGLTLPLREGTHKFDEIMITQDIEKILNFIGLDYEPFRDGFETMEDIFEYVESSFFFTPSIFSYENLNSVNRIRNRKRETYTKFLERVQGKEERYIFLNDKERYLPRIWDFFPEAKTNYDNALAQLNLRKELQAKFNGEIVKSITGLDGYELGQFMKRVKRELDIDLLTEEEIRKGIEGIWKNWNL